jgi:hypothetical protein
LNAQRDWAREMIEKPISELLRLGANHEYLERIAAVGSPIWGEVAVLGVINAFFATLTELGLTVTLRVADDLEELRGELRSCPKDARLDAAQVSKLHKIAEKIWPTLYAESGGMVAYIVSERRFPIERLLEGISSLLGKDVFSELPALARDDFAEAGRCLAFERATAAAFHMLRATESILRDYYCKKLHRKRSELMWGPIIASMRKYPRRFPVPLLNHLDHIRSSFRNPTAHPDKQYDIDEAYDLFSICIDVSNRMVQNLKVMAEQA